MGRVNQRMVRIGVGLLLAIVVVGAGLAPGRAQAPAGLPLRLLSAPAPADAFVPGVVLVRMAASVARAGDVAQRLGVEKSALTPLEIPGQAGLYRLAVRAGDEKASAARLSARLDVQYAEPDYLFFKAETTPNDSLYARYQWNLRHIQAHRGWDRTTGSASVVIGIVDTGVDLGHPDLAGKIVGGIDAANNDSDPQDDNGHGTHVASIAAALGNNAEGVAGVDWKARIMPIKVLDANGSGSSTQLAAGVTWAADNGADILNMSLSGSSVSVTLRNAIQYAYDRGVLLVAAAGNSFKEGNPTSYPAAFEHVVAVAAVNDTDGHASYSNSGSYVDVAAPGGDPSSSADNNDRHWIPGAYWRGSGYAYAWLSGTSQAAPHVAGLAALLLALNPALTPDDLTQIITSSALDVQSPGWDPFSGAGRIDVAAALDAVPLPATATPIPTPTTSPTASPTLTPTASPTPTSTPTPTPPARSRDDVRINSTSARAQSHPALAIDGADKLTVIWRDRRSGVDALYSAGLAADGVNWGANFLLTGTQQISSTEEISPPALALADDGTAVAAWHDDSGGDGEFDVFVSRRGAGMTTWGDPEQVDIDATPPVTQTYPAIALATDGTLVAAWEDARSMTRSGVEKQLYWSQSGGNRGAWSGDRPVALSARGQSAPWLAAGGNRVYAVWVEQNASESRILVAERSLTSTAWLTPTVLVSAVMSGSLAAPDLAADGQGNLLAVWQEKRRTTTGVDIYSAWRLAGGAWSPPLRVGGDRSPSGQFTPRLATNGREAALVWRDGRNDDGDIYVTWATWPGGSWVAEQRVNQDVGAARQSSPDVAIDKHGHTTVVWSDSRTGASAPDIFSRFIPAGERFKVYLPEMER